MCIEFEGIFGTGGCSARPDGEGFRGDCLGELSCCSDTILFTASGLAEGSGGGNGDTDIVVTDAEWAW